MKVHIWSNGCLDNALDELRIKTFFTINGCTLTDKPGQADLIILNTCAFIQDNENEVYQKIAFFNRNKKKRTKIVVGGCLPGINKKKLSSVFTGLTFSPSNLALLNNLINSRKRDIDQITSQELAQTKIKHPILNKWKGFSKVKSVEDILPVIYKKQYLRDYIKNVFPIRIAVGCLGKCSYCCIKRAKGKIKSVSPKNIIDQFTNGIKQRYSKFVLVGDDLGAYGQDLKNENIATLLENLVGINGQFKIALRHTNAQWIIKYYKELKKVFKSNKISSIVIPLQSGSNKILKLMKRGYTVGTIKKCLIDLKSNFPELKIFTHIMVGFPGENEIDFKKTLELVNAVNFNAVYTFKFQARANTPAERMREQIPEEIKKQRYAKACMNSLSLLSKNGFNF